MLSENFRFRVKYAYKMLKMQMGVSAFFASYIGVWLIVLIETEIKNTKLVDLKCCGFKIIFSVWKGLSELNECDDRENLSI